MYCRGAGVEAPATNDGGIVHRAVLAESFDNQSDRAIFLADGHVEALHACVYLIDDRVDSDRSFTGLAVSDESVRVDRVRQRHGVDSLDTRLHRFA